MINTGNWYRPLSTSVCFSGDMEQFQQEFEKLPQIHTPWINAVETPQLRRSAAPSNSGSKSSSASDMEDDGWVQVTRKKR